MNLSKLLEESHLMLKENKIWQEFKKKRQVNLLKTPKMKKVKQTKN